jgi:nucleotide-binding universal stress UspA family protein
MAALLELLHPDGVISAARVFGNNCPPEALPCPSDPPSREAADLVVVAPDEDQARSSSWLLAAAQDGVNALRPTGILYVAAPPPARSTLVAALQARGLVCERAYLQHPRWPDGNVLIPVSHRSLSYAYTRLVPTRPWRRRLVLAALRLPWALRFLHRLAPSAGMVMRHAHAPPLASWLFALTREATPPGDVIVNASWRGGDGAVILVRFIGNSGQPDAIGKSVLSSTLGENYLREAANLLAMEAVARQAGASVPALLAQGERAGQPVLLESVVPGVPARRLLEQDAAQLEPVMARLVKWLERWNRGTWGAETVTTQHVAEFWLEPAAALMPMLAQGEAYQTWLGAACASLLNESIPFVATHNDLTMMNIMISQQGVRNGLGIIDWEAASSAGLPLTDFFYAVVDAVMYAAFPDDRVAAFAACFSPSGSHAAWVAQLQGQLASALDLSADLIRLYFHACWLYHAHTEDASDPGTARPFLDILDRVTREVLTSEGSTDFE